MFVVTFLPAGNDIIDFPAGSCNSMWNTVPDLSYKSLWYNASHSMDFLPIRRCKHGSFNFVLMGPELN